ncbi:MAG: TetR/AcrR family transcriptional regulator [Bacteroidales bacterium]|nr:TetR/AcrR family transcriptional regulator [Bacteroidales bacterium]
MADRIKENILDVAREIFSKFGFRKTTMEEIAQAARKGKSSIYYYFNSKEEIFEAVVKTEANILKKEILDTIETTDDPLEKLRLYIITRIRGIKKLGNFYDAMQNDFLSHLNFIEKARAEYDTLEVEVITGILQQGIEKEEFEIDDPNFAAIALVTILKGLELPLFIDKIDYQLEDRVEDLLTLMYRGIKKR